MIIENPKTSDIPALRQLWQEAFGDTDAYLDSFFSLAFATERALLVREDGGVLAALYWLDCSWEGKKIAYVYAVATSKQHRGKGLCTALMAELHNRVDRTILVPADDGLRTFYSRMGYRNFGGMEESTFFSGSTAVQIEKLTAESYALKRKALIPAGSVLQEGVFLPFLEGMLCFYSGKGFVFACSKQDGKLFVPEFLGDTTLLPGILKSLNCTEARVRCPGKAPFAMYRGINGENSLPEYFAFALD